MDSTVPAFDGQWFAIRVRSNCERKVADSLRMKGLEEFLPLYRRRARWSDRMRDVERPLIPGYVFLRLQIERRLPVLQVPGVVAFVGSGRQPLPIDDREVDALMRVAAASLAAEPWPYLQVGDRVRVDRGPLSGLEGRLEAVKKPARLVITVTLLQRAVAVEIDEHWVSPLSPAHRAPVSGRLDLPARASMAVARPSRRLVVPGRRSA